MSNSNQDSTTSLEQLQRDLLALSPKDKASVIQLLIASLDGKWGTIRKLPDSKGDAFVGDTGISVWFLVSRREKGSADAEILAECPDLSATDLANAWLYARLHEDEIQSAIQHHLADSQSDVDDDSKEDIVNSLKQAWREVKAGDTIPLSQMWEGIDV